MDKTCVTLAGLYCGLGLSVPIVPTAAGIGAVILVRTMLWSRKQTVLWNVCVILLGILATATTLEGRQSSTFIGFWVGIGYGGLGQGIITLGRSTIMNTFKDRFGKALEVFMGAKSD